MGIEDRDYSSDKYKDNEDTANRLRTWRCPQCGMMSVYLKCHSIEVGYVFVCKRCGAEYQRSSSYLS